MIPQLALAAVVVVGGWQLLRRRFVNCGEGTWEDGRRRKRERYLASDNYKPKSYPTVETTEEYVVNARGVHIFTKRWLPIDKATMCGVIIFCHGYSDTCTYAFDDTGHQLAQAGFAVLAMDHEGMGLSAGLHCYIHSFDALVGDVAEFVGRVKADPLFSPLPLFLYGESMGGAVAVQLHRRMPGAFAGAVLLAPMCKIADGAMPPPFLVNTLIFLSRLLPKWCLVPQQDMTEIGFRDPLKRRFLQQNFAAFRSPPRLRSAVQLLRATQDIAAHLEEVSLPLLVLHGQQDRVTDPAVSEALVRAARSRDKTLLLYPESWHGLISAEPDEVAGQVMADVIAWLRQRTEAGGAPALQAATARAAVPA